jgi:hypothetical protein
MRRIDSRAIWLASLVILPGLLLAGGAWDKKPEKWDRADANRILSDSPWAPAKTVVQLFHKDIRTEFPSRAPVEAPRGVKTDVVQGVVWGRELADGPPVLWWSSKTVRLAQQRMGQLQNRAPVNASLHAPDLEHIVIVVVGSEPLRILRDAREELWDTAYLELPSGMALDVAQLKFVEGERAGDDYAAFYFPRRILGEPTVTAEMREVIFRCRATAKTERPGRPNALTIRTAFSPRKMRVNGQPDF